MMTTKHGAVVSLFLASCLLGCGPERIRPVEISAPAASADAMRTYDTDRDGTLAGKELEAVPGIQKHLSKYDLDKDARIDEGEIRQRISDWSAQPLGMRSLSVVVTFNGKPLPGAQVTLDPEPYMGEHVFPASGITDTRGAARVGIDSAHLPQQLQGRGARVVSGGTYKIRVTHPRMKIPEQYNTATILGEEIASDTVRDRIEVDLTD